MRRLCANGKSRVNQGSTVRWLSAAPRTRLWNVGRRHRVRRKRKGWRGKRGAARTGQGPRRAL
eukprot:2047145-Lingulodinium_polyedra.AAC.1